MRRSWVLLPIASLLVGGVVGGAIGYRLGWSQGEERLAQEVVGTIARQVEVLSRLRTGDPAGAVDILETSMDQGVRTVASSRPGVLIAERPTFGAVKLYRSIHPSTPDVAAALEPVETLDLGFCSPALREVASRTRRESE